MRPNTSLTRILRGCASILAVGSAWLAPTIGRAHPAVLTEAEATMEADGRFTVAVRFDTLAFALNDTSARIGNEPMEELMAGPREALEASLTDAKGRFLHGFKVVTERGAGRVESIDFPVAADVLHWKATITPLLPVVLPVQMTGRLPPGAKSVTFQFPSVLTQVVLTEQLPGVDPIVEAVEAGKPSTPLTLAGDTSPLQPPPSLPLSQAQPPAPPPTRGSSQQPDASSGWPDRRQVIAALLVSLLLLALFWTGKRALSGKRTW